MAKATVLEVGNCDPDHATLQRMLTERFDVSIDRVMFVDEALQMLRENSYALVMFNRLVFADGSPGITLIERAASDEAIAAPPMMMISNFAESQAQSIAAGGIQGFGKNAVFDDSTRVLLSKYLPEI